MNKKNIINSSNLLINISKNILQFLIPNNCAACKISMWGNKNPYICEKCLEKIAWINENACRKCGSPAGEYAKYKIKCENCIDKEFDFDQVVGVVRYAAPVSEIIKEFKFYKEKRLAKPMAELMAKKAKYLINKKFDYIIPIPLHKKRYKERGFNQSEVLAKKIAKILNIKMKKNILERKEYTSPQSLLKLTDRLNNPIGAFTINQNLENKNILLIDDIMTTGTTVNECTRVCKENGAENVSALVFAL